MRGVVLSALLALLGACTGTELAFSASARQDLVDNLQVSVDAQHVITECAFAASRGDLDLSGAMYTPPVGNMPGTLTIPEGTFPFGKGDLTIVFTVQGDGNYVDPYAPGIDLAAATKVVVVADVLFTGTGSTGESLSATADFTATTLENGLSDVQAEIDGVFGIDHGQYEFDFTATDVRMDLDLATERVTNVLGNVSGTVDIPRLLYDADFTVDGLGTSLQIDIDVMGAPISYTLLLDELDRRPNIVVILADDLGYADLGVQGARDLVTPHIDSLAVEGVRFPNGYASCPVCGPTRAGLLTGRYQQRFGFEFNPPEPRATDYGLPLEEITLAERLRSKGYATGMVGKWHLGFRPELTPPRRGFDEFFGFLSGARSYFPSDRADPILRGDTPVEESEYLTTAFGREAAAFVERHRHEPFFLYVAFSSVHAPLEATDADLGRLPGIADPKRRAYAAMVASMDDAVGTLLEKLHETGLEERTLVFFLNDNGGPTRETSASNLPFKGRKGQVYEGGIRVPFLVRWKGRLHAGLYEEPVIALDVAATALAAAGIEIPKGFDGINLLPHLGGRNAQPPHDALYWRYGDQRAVRMGEWKLVVREGREELYHLGCDAGEADDLAAAEPARARALREAYEEWAADLMAPRWPRGD